MPYIKAHPFGYKPIKDKPAKVEREMPDRIQTVTIKNEYKTKERNAIGQVIGETTHETTSTRVIKHYDHHPKGRTLGDMVYESIKA